MSITERDALVDELRGWADAEYKPGYTELRALADRLAAMPVSDAEPVGQVVMIDGHASNVPRNRMVTWYGQVPPDGTPLYAAPPALPDEMAVPDPFPVSFGGAHERGYAVGWNACRAAMLAAAPEPPR